MAAVCCWQVIFTVRVDLPQCHASGAFSQRCGRGDASVHSREYSIALGLNNSALGEAGSNHDPFTFLFLFFSSFFPLPPFLKNTYYLRS